MKPSFLGAVPAAILSLAAPAALAAQHTAGDGAMIDVTCEEFLSLPAADQEMHATALTTARMDEATATAAPADEADQGGATDGADEPDDDTSSEETTTATDGVGMNILSPTVVALVTICENTEADSDTGADAEGSDASSD